MLDVTAREIDVLAGLLEHLPGFVESRSFMAIERENKAAELQLLVLNRLITLVGSLEK